MIVGVRYQVVALGAGLAFIGSCECNSEEIADVFRIVRQQYPRHGAMLTWPSPIRRYEERVVCDIDRLFASSMHYLYALAFHAQRLEHDWWEQFQSLYLYLPVWREDLLTLTRCEWPSDETA